MQCPCQSSEEFEACCADVLKDPSNAETAEQLMRARYTAYNLKKMDFLEKTHDPKTIKKYDLAAAKEWAEQAEFTNLEIRSTRQGEMTDEIGWVEFVAHYSMGEQSDSHEEMSEFRKIGGQWFYTTGVDPKKAAAVSTKVGRNEPCPCGSERKYKVCCGKN